mgnify:CR=1 FL=1|tara:strand:+ start:1167 stop:2270 length:1104 start_codon:yes stop_codon:yes gene_type:complete
MTEELSKSRLQLKRDCIVNERCVDPLIKVRGLAYIVLERPKLDEAVGFFTDFGLLVDHRDDERIYLRGASVEHQMLVIERGRSKMLRIGMKASEEDVKKLAEIFSLQLQDHDDVLGGKYISLTDPDGVCIEVCFGLRSLTPLPPEAATVWNGAGDNKPRRGERSLSPLRPARVHKVGHTVHSVASMQATLNWYQHTLGMIVSDFQFLENDPLPAVAFMRCDCGDEVADHHTFGFGSAPILGHMHTAFELDNLEDLLVGNTWLKERKHKHSWGIGRHVLGSQIFDYWREPDGEVFEHYVDGDVFPASQAAGYHWFNSEAQHQWGPEITADVTGQNKPLATVAAILRRIRSGDDLTVGRIRRLLKAVNS